MAQVSEIKASARPRAGTGGSRAVRREGRVPGIVYGNNAKPENISVDRNELTLLVGKGKFLSTVFDLSIDGTTSRVIPRDVQLDPVKDLPVHVDFQRVGPSARIRVNVPVVFLNEALSPGLKRGGVLNIVRHEVEVTCPADAIPDHFEVNLEGLEIGRSVHISAVKLPEGVKPTIRGRDFTVATIAGHRVEDETKPEGGEVAAAAAGGEAAAGGDAAAVGAPAAGKAAAAGAAAKAPAGKEAAGGKGGGDKGKK